MREYLNVKKEDITKEIFEEMVLIMYENRYELKPNLFKRLKVNEEDPRKNVILIVRIQKELEKKLNDENLEYVLVKEDGKTIAFSNHLIKEGRMDITKTMVCTMHQNKGIGQKMNEILEEKAKDLKLKEIRRSTWHGDERQKHIYEKFNYLKDCEEENYYGDKYIKKVVYKKEI